MGERERERERETETETEREREFNLSLIFFYHAEMIILFFFTSKVGRSKLLSIQSASIVALSCWCLRQIRKIITIVVIFIIKFRVSIRIWNLSFLTDVMKHSTRYDSLTCFL